MMGCARLFAIAAHDAVGQKRKYTGDPYWVHPRAVAEIVGTVDHTTEMLAAAWLHDVVEDTKITNDTILKEFGSEVAMLVYWLTDQSTPEDGNRATRKKLDLDHTALASPEAKTIKLADIIDNTKTIRAYDPNFWRVYRSEMSKLMEVLKGGDKVLWERASEGL